MKNLKTLLSLFIVLLLLLLIIFNHDSIKLPRLFNPYDELVVHYLSTGNSDCSIIEYGDKRIVIDGGDLDDGVLIVKYLERLGTESIYVLEMSHPDADHVGGLGKIVESFDIEYAFVSNGSSETYSYKSFIEALANKGISPSVPLDEAKLELDKDTYLQFFNTKEIYEDSNDNSIITLLVHGEDRFVFAGDASTYNQAVYANYLKDIDVLKVAHHGSYKNSNYNLLKNYNPTYAVITCGKNNDYGHPHKQVLNTLEQLNITVLRTDELKTIKIVSTGKGVKYLEGE